MTANPPDRLTTLRDLSRAMLDGYDETTLRRQPHPALSPLLWHVGHVFFVENYWLAEQVFGDTRVTDPWRTLYFPELCAKGERSARLPGPAEMVAWTRELDAVNDTYWQRAQQQTHDLLADGYLRAFIRQHYAQHIETMRMARAQLALGETPPALTDVISPRPSVADRITLPAGTVVMGTTDIVAYDNERPTVERSFEPFDIARRPVDNGQWLGFINDDGYHDSRWWDAAGWAWRTRHAITHPQHWQPTRDGHGWHLARADDAPVETTDSPVHGIGWHEARAYARWAGARLPTEVEWEAAARSGRLEHVGQVWEWCDNAFAPYPGFQAFPYDEYSMPWFDGKHFVARGASRATEADIRRPGFRNFYPPTHRHVFAGLRLAWST
ncbi:SUMF1/EgtB/PvdO family nonheme iron enzyme [Salinisphaera sp. Q1T1-3]|uniref:SUMF1/EgtB/PvdO family nonheme iron enzyme n=1 Tax=Salinisphaera sp. Q1T1-3 TaxID=2321229 RepID=UPI000E731DA1|nr:SUMF1/EgtB/PvdO family nonheme iron enzyme [Salinisphaera sp. Q1T1-3]RJS93830.1 ergothioneine biosynthesis protein EgtB [Salinisphaera sp. Q1T1-3]